MLRARKCNEPARLCQLRSAHLSAREKSFFRSLFLSYLRAPHISTRIRSRKSPRARLVIPRNRRRKLRAVDSLRAPRIYDRGIYVIARLWRFTIRELLFAYYKGFPATRNHFFWQLIYTWNFRSNKRANVIIELRYYLPEKLCGIVKRSFASFHFASVTKSAKSRLALCRIATRLGTPFDDNAYGQWDMIFLNCHLSLSFLFLRHRSALARKVGERLCCPIIFRAWAFFLISRGITSWPSK